MLSSLEGRVHFRSLDRIGPFVDDADFSPYPVIKGRLVEFVTCEGRYVRLAWSEFRANVRQSMIDKGYARRTINRMVVRASNE